MEQKEYIHRGHTFFRKKFKNGNVRFTVYPKGHFRFVLNSRLTTVKECREYINSLYVGRPW